MKLYHDLTQCSFLCRVNRFIAKCSLNGEEVTVHVKNTGRLRELQKQQKRQKAVLL